jgi:UDP-4-amino-4,6-dideoxy-N-acetyl-beta-L-altrosamine N-acetyltransferase
MQISKYGVTLKRLEARDLEMVRSWRNAGHVRPYMEYKEYITAAGQQAWFRGLDPSTHIYFIIQKREAQIGVVNLKDVDAALKTAEAGIFIGNTDYLDSMIPVLATISLMEFAFDALKLHTLKAKISSANTKVIAFNQSIGYKKSAQQRDHDFQYYTVTHSDFISATQGLRHMLEKIR